MQTRPIARTGLTVTPLSFGTSALGNMPDTYGYEVDAARAQETVEAILAGPVTMLDTSNIYGFGRSEERVGAAIRALGGLPEGFVLSTKLDRDAQTGRFDAERVRRSVGESLERLGLDSIPLLHLHDPEHARDLSEITREGGALDALFRLKEEGIAQAVGLAMGRLDIMEPMVRDRPFDAVITHNRMTILNRAASGLLDHCATRGIAVINAAPYAGGVLAKGSAEMPRITYQDAGDAALAPVRAVEAICAAHGVAPGAVALQFSMRDARVTSTLVGVSRPERVRQTLDWATAEIPEALWQDIAALDHATTDPEAERDYRPG